MSARGRKARMTPTKLLIGQILVVLAIIVASIWAATQWAAAQLAHQPELGATWFVLLDQPIYHPLPVFPWWFSFDASALVIFDLGGPLAATRRIRSARARERWCIVELFLG